MPRLIHIADAAQRDAHVAIERAPRPPARRYVAADGRETRYARLIKTTEGHDYAALLARFGDDAALAQALVDGDPELDLSLTGRLVGPADRVYIRPDGSVLYAARVLRVTLDPDGEELDRSDFVDVEATVTEDQPLPWTGRLFDLDDVVRRFVFTRVVQLRHVNGLTFDFLFEMARTLSEARQALLVGSGPRGAGPLVFQRNGSPYRGFLEGRVAGDGYVLLLHLSNLELKRPAGDGGG